MAMNLTFAGCGFLGIYHIGVATAFSRHGGKLLFLVQRFGGASAGALVASALTVKGSDLHTLEKCRQFCLNLAAGVHKKKMGLLTPQTNLLAPVEAFIDDLLPEDAHIRASGRLFVSLSNVNTRRNELISKFNSRDDLIKCLIGSSYIPFITGTRPVKLNGKTYMDGGITDNLPILPGGRTVCVSPFSGTQEICPRDKSGKRWYTNISNMEVQVNRKNLTRGLHTVFPPSVEKLQSYYEMGQRDAVRFLRREGLYSADDSHSNPESCNVSPPGHVTI